VRDRGGHARACCSEDVEEGEEAQVTSETSDEERARATAVSSTDDATRTYGSTDETEKIMTGEGEQPPVPPRVVREDRDASEPRGWPGEDSAGQRADG
jgi:hypothetical protein